MKIVIDSSVWIAGIGSRKGFSNEAIFKSYKNAEIEIFITDQILIEVKDNLIKKLKFDPNLANEAERIINNLCEANINISKKEKISFKKIPEKDRHLLILCQKINPDYLITFDRKHLLPLKKFDGTLILEPKDFVKTIDSYKWNPKHQKE